jgi:glycosyltransferase involved in cell wall biosynthesis
MTNISVQDKVSDPLDKKTIKVYMMELWTFIPYYMASLCTGLCGDSAEVVLGSVRYHLDRDYFRKAGVTRDTALLDLGGAIRFARLRRLVKICEYLANLLVLAVRLCVSRPDVLHVQYLPFLERGFRFEIWFMKWVRLLGTRVVYTVHNLTPQDMPERYKHIYRSAYKTPDALICHGKDARLQLIQEFAVPSEKIWVIPHGPLFAEKLALSSEDARAKLGLKAEGPLVLSLGVISRYKGIFFLLDAWKHLVDLGVRARLLIAGTGDALLLSEIRERVSEKGIEPSVDLWLRYIPVEQLPLLYQAADILVYPYKAGTTSGALLTGMNYAKAAVATTLPFFQEHLTHEKNALFVRYGDVTGLAEALAELIRDPLKRERLGKGIMEAGNTQQSWGKIAKATLECYKAVCHVPPVSRSQGDADQRPGLEFPTGSR